MSTHSPEHYMPFEMHENSKSCSYALQTLFTTFDTAQNPRKASVNFRDAALLCDWEEAGDLASMAGIYLKRSSQKKEKTVYDGYAAGDIVEGLAYGIDTLPVQQIFVDQLNSPYEEVHRCVQHALLNPHAHIHPETLIRLLKDSKSENRDMGLNIFRCNITAGITDHGIDLGVSDVLRTLMEQTDPKAIDAAEVISFLFDRSSGNVDPMTVSTAVDVLQKNVRNAIGLLQKPEIFWSEVRSLATAYTEGEIVLSEQRAGNRAAQALRRLFPENEDVKNYNDLSELLIVEARDYVRKEKDRNDAVNASEQRRLLQKHVSEEQMRKYAEEEKAREEEARKQKKEDEKQQKILRANRAREIFSLFPDNAEQIASDSVLMTVMSSRTSEESSLEELIQRLERTLKTFHTYT